ncbi:S1 family peptidase [Nocardiopsis gilva YIM 90087]|uniref:S1 family peptidase n=1 Tax=Nocardiopsis gilva YIM 90087 TaxID=1235441 RepID=A0A223S3L4_9ACTN|nr:S1 family peptidase [Nocardiopsis gilva YIM 90087]
MSLRKSPFLAALSTGVLALGLTGTTPGTATADQSTPAPSRLSAGHLQALQRDLGVDPQEAAMLSQQTDAARTLESQARAVAGDAFGGAVFDIETGGLTVAVTDRKAADAVDDLGATTELVERSEDELTDVVTKLNEAEDAADASVTGWYLDPRANGVVVTVLDGGQAAAADLIAQAGVDAEAVTIDEGADRPRTFANTATDIHGGNPYYNPRPDRTYVCSVGFGVEGGYVTAGHCGERGKGAFHNAGLTVRYGKVADADFPGTDMGWVKTTGRWTPTRRVNDYNGGSVTVAGAEEAPVGAAVCRSGQTTGWHCGTIQAKNQTVYVPHTVHGLTRTTVCAEPGDSGGPYLSGDQAQGVTSGGAGNCTSGGTTFFQPLRPIIEKYDLTLLTS